MSTNQNDEATTVTIADLVLDGVRRVEESGGWDAPSKRAETGYQYDSYVYPEPLGAVIEAWVDEQQYQRLAALRDSSEPFPASVDHVNLAQAKLNDLTVESEGQYKSHRRVTIDIAEIREADVDDAELWIDTPAGEMGSAAADVSPSVAYPQDDDTGVGDDATGEGGVVGALSSVRESLSGVL